MENWLTNENMFPLKAVNQLTNHDTTTASQSGARQSGDVNLGGTNSLRHKMIQRLGDFEVITALFNLREN